MQLCENGLAVIYLGLEVLISVKCLELFLEPEIQSAIGQSLPAPAHQRKARGTKESVRGFLLIPGCGLSRGLA